MAVLTELEGFPRVPGVPAGACGTPWGQSCPWQTGNTERLPEATKERRVCAQLSSSASPAQRRAAGGKGALQEEGLPWSGVRTAPQRKGWWDPCRLQDEGDSRQVGRREDPRLREQQARGWRLRSGVVGGKALVSLLSRGVTSHGFSP